MSARIGVIGCGWWATRAHLPALQANPDAVIAGIAAPGEEPGPPPAGRFEPPPERVFAEAGELRARAELEAPIVAAPHPAHAPLPRAVLEHGVHLLLEKPMPTRPADARALAAL